MDRRREMRVETTLPVRIWGIDTYSRPFMQLATVRNFSSLGAVLQNVRSKVNPGEIGLERLPEEPYLWDVDPTRCGQEIAIV